MSSWVTVTIFLFNLEFSEVNRIAFEIQMLLKCDSWEGSDRNAQVLTCSHRELSSVEFQVPTDLHKPRCPISLSKFSYLVNLDFLF